MRSPDVYDESALGFDWGRRRVPLWGFVQNTMLRARSGDFQGLRGRSSKTARTSVPQIFTGPSR
jgi:hypothetical protein